MINVLILCQYPHGAAASQRFRFEQYLELLNSAGIKTTQVPFFSYDAWQILYTQGNFFKKTFAVLSGFTKRFFLLFHARQYDFVFIHREATPFGPPIIEFLLFLIGCRVIYDFDDAIFIPRTSKSNWFIGPFRWPSKIAYITKNAHITAVCNPYLVDWASKHSDSVVLIPTTIDPKYHTPPPKNKPPGERVIIGWTGTHSTSTFLDLVRPALRELEKEFDFEFRVIADKDPGCPGLKNYRFIKWRFESEIDDLSSFDIGLMPVPKGTWSNGKVGFKVIQYSALEIAPIASSTGSGHEVVLDRETGLVVDNSTEKWVEALRFLLKNPALIKEYGKKGREHIFNHYSVPSQTANYLKLFR